MMFRVSPFIYLFFLFSCKQKVIQSGVSLRDTVLSTYLTAMGSIPAYDTNNTDFRMLRAYYRNDTNYLQEYLGKRKQYLAYLKKEDYKLDHVYPDSCIHQQRLDSTNYEEAYRFKYTQSFCPYKINVTVLRKADSTSLSFLLYKPADDPQFNTAGCKIIEQYSKTLSPKDWTEIRNAMTHADFWALNRINDIGGLDGSTLEVEGFLSERLKTPHPPKYHLVRRWIGPSSALFEAFATVLKLSGNKQGCFVVK
jgi:hypothetical protein